MRTLRSPTQEQAGALIAMIAVMFGAWVRLLIPWMAGFPVNDGGLFYVMLRALQLNGLRIPDYVQYNGLRIPFAYPPLGFYAGVIAANIVGTNLITVLQWLPAIVTVAAVPAFYLLAKTMLADGFRAGIATLVYAFTPRAITWQVMGGGLTRSFGQVFLIFALACIYRALTKNSRRDFVLAVLFSSLVVLSHPEAALQTVGSALLLWLLKGRDKTASLRALEIGAGTLLMTSVWWLPAIAKYGIGTLLSAAQTGQHSLLFLFQPLLMSFVDEPLMTLIAVLGVIGIAYELAHRRTLLTLWFLVPFLVEPRSAPTVAVIPLAMLTAVALAEAILPTLAGLNAMETGRTNLMRCRPVGAFLLFIGLYMLGNSSYYGTQLTGTVLSPANRAAFGWVKANTPGDARFLLLTGRRDELFCDGAQEWFPALSDRVSVTTIQGREWLPARQFGEAINTLQALQRCAQAESPVSCLKQATSSGRGDMQYDYILADASRPITQNCRRLFVAHDGQSLIDNLKASTAYRVVYDTDGVVIFNKR